MLTLRSAKIRSSAVLGNKAFAPIQSTANAFATSGDSEPTIGQWAGAFYDATSNTTWLPFAGSPDGVTRNIYVKTYNHSHGVWSPGVTSPGTFIAANPNTDSHGEPGAVMDQYGYVHVFYGAHQVPLKYAYTKNPRNPSAWTLGPDIGTHTTCANPVLCNGLIYLFTQGTNEQLTYFVGTPSASGGATWSAEKAITAFGTSFGWLGNAVVVGTKIYFGFTFSPIPDTYIADAYFAYLETADGSLHNVNSSTIIAAGSLPISRGTAQTNFAVFLTPDTAHSSIIPSIAFDNNNQPHILYANGLITNTTSSLGSYILYDSYWNGSAWTAGVQIAGIALANYFFSSPILVTTATGIAAFWGQGNGILEDAYTATWTQAGGWSTATKIQSAYQWPLSNYTPVTNSIGQARVLFAESSPLIAADHNALYGTLALWAYGDSGFLTAPWGTPSGNVAHWPFDAATTNFGSNTTLDTSGNNVTGTLSNMTSAAQVTGEIAEALSFTNVGSNAISFGNNATIKPALPLSITLWYKPSSFDAAFNNLIMTDTSLAVYAGLVLQATDNGSVDAYYGDGAGLGAHYWEKLKGNNVLLALGSYNFVAVTVASQNIAIYINGIASNGANGDSFGTATTIGYTTSPAEIAGIGGVGNAPSGPVDDMRIYNRILAPWEVSQIMWQGLQGHQ